MADIVGEQGDCSGDACPRGRTARQTATSAVGRLLIATSPDPIMSSTASISSKPEKPIGRWAASEPQEAPANTTKPLTASAPARDEPLRLPTSAIVEGTMVATPRTKI